MSALRPGANACERPQTVMPRVRFRAVVSAQRSRARSNVQERVQHTPSAGLKLPAVHERGELGQAVVHELLDDHPFPVLEPFLKHADRVKIYGGSKHADAGLIAVLVIDDAD